MYCKKKKKLYKKRAIRPPNLHIFGRPKEKVNLYSLWFLNNFAPLLEEKSYEYAKILMSFR